MWKRVVWVKKGVGGEGGSQDKRLEECFLIPFTPSLSVYIHTRLQIFSTSASHSPQILLSILVAVV